ncbi:serine/arginine-rich splicing factor 7-like isoform X2 [Lineus longissimus]|uniref:serine/arginine-rich splicing factor 7-like isoform X2 n=1 Tax=Lineus longissimus TaxID=88925 RepID=UPI002B4F4EE6
MSYYDRDRYSRSDRDRDSYRDRDRGRRDDDRAPLDCKVYVGDLPRNCTERDIEDEFGTCGRLKNVWVARNPSGFAFVEYEDPRDAEDAVRRLDGVSMKGNRIRVEHSTGKVRPKPWMRRGPPRSRKPFHPDDKCFECHGRGHYAYDCPNAGRRSRSRSRSSSRGGGRSRRRYSRSRSRSRSRSYSRSRSRSNDRHSKRRSRSRSRSHHSRKSRSPSRHSSPGKDDDRKNGDH